MSYPHCPKCNSKYVYEDRGHLICPECGYEWNPDDTENDLEEFTVSDANGAVLTAGDKVMIIKDLKIKGSSHVIKIGTKATIKRIIEGKDHELDCKLAGAGEMMITAKFVKKA